MSEKIQEVTLPALEGADHWHISGVGDCVCGERTHYWLGDNEQCMCRAYTRRTRRVCPDCGDEHPCTVEVK